MGGICSHSAKYAHVTKPPASKFMVIDNNECCRRIYRAMTTNDEFDDFKGGDAKRKRKLQTPRVRKWISQRDATKCKILEKYRCVLGPLAVFEHSAEEMAAAEEEVKRNNNEGEHNDDKMYFRHFEEFMHELLWAVFQQNSNNEDNVQHSEKNKNKSKKRYSVTLSRCCWTTLTGKSRMLTVISSPGSSNCSEESGPRHLKDKNVSFSCFATFMLRSLARNLDRGPHSLAPVYNVEIAHLIDHILIEAESEENFIIKGCASSLRSYMSDVSFVASQDSICSFVESLVISSLFSRKLQHQRAVAKESRQPFKDEEDLLNEPAMTLGGDSLIALTVPDIYSINRGKDALDEELLQTIKGMTYKDMEAVFLSEESNLLFVQLYIIYYRHDRIARRIVTQLRTTLPRSSTSIRPTGKVCSSMPLKKRNNKNALVLEVIESIDEDTNPISSSMRLTRLHQRLSSDQRHLNWVGIDILEHLRTANSDNANTNNNPGTILLSPLSVSAMLLMAQEASVSTTKYEIQEFLGDIDDHDLESYDIFEDMFSTLSYGRNGNADVDAELKRKTDVCFAHSLWLPGKYSTRYGHAVNAYVSGHVGGFQEDSYFPVDQYKEKRKERGGEKNQKKNNQQEHSHCSPHKDRSSMMAVDRWVMSETNGKVARLFGRSLSSSVSSMLLGVVTFKMPWKYAFSSPMHASMQKNPSLGQFPVGWFRVGERHRMKCRYMTTHRGVGLSYITSKDALVVNVPFASGLAAMIAIPRHKKRRQELRKRRSARQQQQRDDEADANRSGKKDEDDDNDDSKVMMFRNLYDPPSLEHILHGNNASEPKSLHEVLERMNLNRSRGKVVDELTLPMGTVEWTGNIKHAVRKRFFISEVSRLANSGMRPPTFWSPMVFDLLESALTNHFVHSSVICMNSMMELFEEEEADLGSAIGEPHENAHVSGMIQRNSLELIPDGAINGGSDRSTVSGDASSKREGQKKKRHMRVDSPFLIVIHHRGQSVMMGYIHGVKSPDVDTTAEKCDEALNDPWREIKAKIATDIYDEPLDDSDDDSDLDFS
eukprot:jgi/Bigna1/73697/fgenesh1_pg.25_\